MTLRFIPSSPLDPFNLMCRLGMTIPVASALEAESFENTADFFTHGLVDEGEDENKFVNHSLPFPWRLHEILDAAGKEEFTNIVSWLPDGQSFKVYKVENFVRDIMPNYFRQTKYKSFQRQLNMWGFERLLSGPSKGGYSHTNFVRGQAALCLRMQRVKIKGKGAIRPTHASTDRSPFNFSSKGMSPRVVSSDGNSNSKEGGLGLSSAFSLGQISNKNARFSRAQQQQQFLGVAGNIATHASKTQGSYDLIDADLLLSIFSSVADDDKNTDKAPNDGDCVPFEGMHFFSVQDYDASKRREAAAGKAMRRLSMEVGRKRLSLIGGNTSAATKSVIAGLPSSYFSIDALSQHPKGSQRACRRFSLQQGGFPGPTAT